MNRAQLLAAARNARYRWLDEHADTVPAVPADSSPHDGPGGPSDYAEHAADRSAPAVVDDLLSAELQALLDGEAPDDWTEPEGGAPVVVEESDRPVDDAGDVILAEGWTPQVPNVVADLAEAGSDRKLRAYWVRGEGAAKIGWGKAGDFAACVSHLGKYVSDPEGLCAEYHKAATGKWPGKNRGH